MGLINKRAPAETPDDWREVMTYSRVKPSPFEVIECKTEMFKKWGEFLDSRYQSKFATATRPIKQLRIVNTCSQTVEHRDSYTGLYILTTITE